MTTRKGRIGTDDETEFLPIRFASEMVVSLTGMTGAAHVDGGVSGPLALYADATVEDVVTAVRQWIESAVPAAWVTAGRQGGPAAVRDVRSRADYEAWYPTFGRSGLVAASWPRRYGGLGLPPDIARRADEELRPFNLGRLNPLGLNLAAPALFAHGTEEQRLRFLPPIVRNEEVWCQLFSEPGAGSDLASLSTRAERDGDEWVITGQKVWTTWAHLSDWAVLLARTDIDVPKRRGLTYFLLNLRQGGVDVRPLRHMGGEVDFNEVFLTEVRISDALRVGAVGAGWEVANATLSSERQMVSGGASGGVDRIGGSGVGHLIRLAQARSAEGRPGGWNDPVRRDEIMRLYCEERVREWTNLRARRLRSAGRPPGPESSVGKVQQAQLNQKIQVLATSVLGMAASAWAGEPGDYAATLPYEVRGMLRSRANTIEGGTTEINKNILGERVLGLPREPDQFGAQPWKEVPRN
jgi:alkylation response protein AidB-like acyl-CoA dehydrogenase